MTDDGANNGGSGALTALFGLEGRVAVVTGASSGLGNRFALVLHGAGAHVVVAARRADRLDVLAAELGDRVTTVSTDLTVAADRERLTTVALEVSGRIDVLVNNAGHSDPTPAESETLEHFASTMDINTVAPFHLCQLVGRSMLAAGEGSIVNVASIWDCRRVAHEGRQLLRLEGCPGQPDPPAWLRVGPQGGARATCSLRAGSPPR